MNELTKKMQEIMVPKAALIAYEYRESPYATGKNYLELRPINKAGRMEAGNLADFLNENNSNKFQKQLI